ncbi:MAG: hypothetical protein IJI78_03915 [Oscillospiraceae bacterium]|nr:hypothetical protein [Oscillospiraceae bacterium]
MKILFIGNSHTYMNDMPKLVSDMVENSTRQLCEVFMLAYSGRSLKWHMAEEYFSERFNILYGHYDYCVIQEQAHPMTDESDTITYTNGIIKLCKKANTKPVIFETWAEKDKPENQVEMNRRYRKLADDSGAILAPIGEVWAAVLSSLPSSRDEDLYFRDGEHASAIGDYLIAMVLTKTITGRLPDQDFLKALDFSGQDDSWIPANEDTDGELIRVSPETAAVIRKKVIDLV